MLRSRSAARSMRCFSVDAIEKFHGDECLPVLLANVVNRADIWMVQCRCGFGLAPEARQCLRIACHFVGKKLQGYEAAKTRVFSLIDHSHATAAQLFHDAVVRNGFSDHRRVRRAILGCGELTVNEQVGSLGRECGAGNGSGTPIRGCRDLRIASRFGRVARVRKSI